MIKSFVEWMLRIVLSGSGNVLVFVLGLHTDNDAFECLEGKHGGHGGRHGSNEIGSHAAVEGSPALFIENSSACLDDTLVSRFVDHAVGTGNASLLCL